MGMEIHLETMGDAPVEMECPGCGQHHVIDPADIRRLLARKRFKCEICNQRRARKDLGSLFADHTRVAGVCTWCVAMLDASSGRQP